MANLTDVPVSGLAGLIYMNSSSASDFIYSFSNDNSTVDYS